jgi:hypothetical protein
MLDVAIGDPSKNLPYAGNERERPSGGVFLFAGFGGGRSRCGIRLSE